MSQTHNMDSKQSVEKIKYSFGLIRLCLAILVIFEHSFILGGFGKDPLARITNEQLSTALVAVMSFFVISGFLITKSYLDSPNIINYAWKRFLRIIPAFWVCLAVVAFCFAPLLYFFENRSLSGYLSLTPVGPFEFIIDNLFLLIRHYSIGNILSDNPFPFILNGSLWTLFLEAKAYVLLGFLGIFGILRNRRIIILLLYLISLIFIASGLQIEYVPNPLLRLALDHYFLIFLCYFFAGSTLFLYKEKIVFSWKVGAFLMILTGITATFGLVHIALPILLPYVLVLASMKINQTIFDRKIDLSYGTYIYSFPVMQALAFFGLNTSHFFYFILSIFFTLPFALFSWFVVEKPSLNLKRI